MPTLHWIGKEKVVNHHQEVPFKVLEWIYNYELGVMNDELNNKNHNSSIITHNSSGAIIHGDNLEALKALLPQYEGKIKCIYIDPPYNTGNENWVYNDNVNDPKIKKWLGQVVGKESEDLSRHDKWLCMMYPRLKLLHKLLADDGAIFISIDDNEQANLKLICDEIFGGSNFVCEFIWKNKSGGANDSKLVANDHEYILCYSKNQNSISFNLDKEAQVTTSYNLKDEKGEYALDRLDKQSLGYMESLDFPIIGKDGEEYRVFHKDPNNKVARWRWGKDTVKERYNELVFKNGFVYTKNYKKEGVISRSLLVDERFGRTRTGKTDLKLVFDNKSPFDYPKPISLVSYLISICADKNSIILDSFAGSGTTAHAVLNLNQQDGGNRKFILIEMEDYAESITAERVRRVINGYADKEGTGGSFSFYELGQPLFDPEHNLNEAVGIEKIREYIWYSETKSPLGYYNDNQVKEKYLLGTKDDSVYYFIYEKDRLTTLDFDSLDLIKTKASQYIIYADNCLLPYDFMNKHNIIFKKIPRDINKL